MAAGFPLSRQASQPEQTTQPTPANEAPHAPSPARAAAPPPSRVFQSAPDLIRSLLPGSAAAANALGLDPGAPGSRLYRFEALEIKELSHRLDGVLWPREITGCAETGSPEFPVVLLEVQMHPDSGFHGRLSAQSLRFVQRHPRVEHLEVVMITPHHRLRLGPSNPPQLLQAVGAEVH